MLYSTFDVVSAFTREELDQTDLLRVERLVDVGARLSKRELPDGSWEGTSQTGTVVQAYACRM
jgi:hypothetical protein